MKISGSQLLGLKCECVLKIILNERMPNSINQLINDKDVFRTAPASPGLLTIVFLWSVYKSYKFSLPGLDSPGDLPLGIAIYTGVQCVQSVQ